MQYYIYPNGKVGLDISNILETIGFKDKFRLIDDEFFTKNHEKIASGTILISSKKYYFDIARKCKEYLNGLIKYIDGMEFVANKLDEFVLNISPKHKNIGVILGGPAGSKHYGMILEILMQKGYKLFFFANNYEDITDIKGWFKKGIFIKCYEREIFKFISSITFLINEGYEKFCANTTSLYIPHTFSLADNKFINPKTYKNQFYNSMMSSDFITIASKKDNEYLLNLTKELIFEDLSYKILKFGSPSLEVSMNSYGEFKKVDKKAVLLAFGVVGLEYESEIIELISYILKNQYKVYFRPHPHWKKHGNLTYFVKNIIALFKNNENFIFDDSIKLTEEIKKNIITLISDISSLTFTFALTTLRPSIIFIPKSCDLYSKIDEICEKDIHIYVSTKEDCLEKIKDIWYDQIKFKERILDYKTKNIFSLSPSDKIANFIDETIRLKHHL